MDVCNKDLNGEETVGTFYEKEFKQIKKANQIEFRVGEEIKRNEINYMSNDKVMIMDSIVRLKKRHSINE